jgi:hypothetical protein
MFGYQQPVSYAFDGVGLGSLCSEFACGVDSSRFDKLRRSLYWSNTGPVLVAGLVRP